ncbi:iron ABC transporter substrate-binding protein [Candidatus Magnetomorum sp. HK-1]|nr:iron ABC transporter substrate-binding protein [Candidatus Magnetomorum sp. HK-1]
MVKLYCQLFIGILSLTILFLPVLEAKEQTDQLGRKMIVPDDPKRVVSLAPSITEIIYAIKQEHRLVGVTRFSDYPPQASKFTKVGSYIQLDLEKIVSLKPDLCIAVKDGNPKAVVFRIESFGIPVYAVDPRNLHSVIETIKEIGKLLHSQKEAFLIVQEMEIRIQNIKSKTSSISNRPRVFFQIGISPIVSVGTDTFFHELITIAGGINLTSGAVPYPRYTKEQVIALSPEVFFISSMARKTVFERVKKEWQQWQNIPAVRNNRIHLVESNVFDRAAPRLVDGLEFLLQKIHPTIN